MQPLTSKTGMTTRRGLSQWQLVAVDACADCYAGHFRARGAMGMGPELMVTNFGQHVILGGTNQESTNVTRTS